AACSREPAPPGEAGFLRLIDHLAKQNVLTSPLKEHPESSPKEAVYPPDSSLLQDAGTGENPFGIKRKCRVGGTARNILFAPPETRLRYDFDRLVGMELEFGIGILPAGDAGETRPDTARRSGGVSFQVELDTDRGKEVVFQKYLPLPSRAEDPVFSWQRIGLPEEAGRVRLSLITRGDRDGFSFWSNPILLEKKNDVQAVILISVDTLRGDHLGCYGYERETSPHVDTLAAEGVTFLKTYASSPWTLPSHVSLLSAFHTVHHQVYREDDAMDPSVVTLADIMRGEGFYCAGFTGGGFVSSVYGFSKGFDTYSDDAGSVYRQDAAEHLGRLVKEWLKTHTGKDFFLFLHTYQPHNPYACPPPYKTLFLGENPKWRHLDLMSHLGGKPGIFQRFQTKRRRMSSGSTTGRSGTRTRDSSEGWWTDSKSSGFMSEP
ncbi:MAG: sulfatase-like hydrolase/transferase, partial [Candidatus Aminicenantales bacterium]